MPTLRSLRLLGAVEAGTVTSVTSPNLQTYLTDMGRNAEFAVLLGMRGQARRMAGNDLTMAAITTSAAARDTVFKAATTENNAACKAVVTSAVAMNSVSVSTPSLLVVAANPVAWSLFNKSSHYESNIKTVLANYAAVNPAVYPTVTALVEDPLAMASIALAANAMRALVASPPTLTTVAANSLSTGLITANATAIDIVASETAIMGIVANSTEFMGDIASRPVAAQRMAAYPGAIVAIAKVPTAWATYMGSPSFAGNLPLALANLIGVSPGDFPTLSSIIADATVLGKVAANKAAVQALASNSAAMTTLSTSPNLGIILGSATAMAVIGPNDTAMTSFLNAGKPAWDGLFGSSVAKGFIVKSTPLVDAIRANAALRDYLAPLAKTLTAPGVPDGNATSLQPYLTMPAKVLTLGARETGIAATYGDYNFGGDVVAGTGALAVLSLTGAATLPPKLHVAGYTNMSWNFNAIGVTAATVPVIIYIDMT